LDRGDGSAEAAQQAEENELYTDMRLQSRTLLAEEPAAAFATENVVG
jgi:hypothetical protein